MKSITRILTGLAVTASIVLFACKKESSVSAPGSARQSLSIFLTDGPTPSFDKVLVDIRNVEACVDTTTKNGLDIGDRDDRRKDDTEAGDAQDDHGNGNGSSGQGGDNRGGSGNSGANSGGGSSDCNWVSLDIKAGIYDLLTLRNGTDALLANGSLPKGKIRNIRLTLGDGNSVVVAGNTLPLQISAGSNQVTIRLFNGNIAVAGTSRFSLHLDFDASRSIAVIGGNFTLKPVLKAFCDEKSGRIEGRVQPSAAAPITVTVFNSTDTGMAIPEKNEGEFRIRGLKDGTYSVLFQGANGYRDTTITDILVKSGSEVKLPTITLHP
jgi:hypothetical protein